MNAVSIIIDIVLILISIVLIIAVLMQQGQRQGLGAISGGAETFFGKSKAKSYEAKLAKITKFGAAVFIVLAIVATIVTSNIMAEENSTTPSVDEILGEQTPGEDEGATLPLESAEPTGDASAEPSESAAAEPTATLEQPTEAPTEAPTEVPTDAPSDAPTAEPAA